MGSRSKKTRVRNQRERMEIKMKDITYEIIEHIGVFDDSSDTWTGQVNIVSWNGNKPKIDVRYWNAEVPTKNRRVGTLSDEAAARLGEILCRIAK